MNKPIVQGAPGALDYLLELARKARLIVGGGLLAGALAVAGSYLVKPIFTSITVILPPAQASSMAAQAAASLGALASIAGGGLAGRTPLDQYVALINSTTVADRMIERFKLLEAYDEELRLDARKKFWKRLRVAAGRRDGLITIEVDDEDPSRAREMAAAMVDEFRRIASEIAVTEAQQRRRFFEQRVEEAKQKLSLAQEALQAGGFAAGALKAEPKAAAEGYARLRAEYTAAQVRLQALLSTFTPQAPEVQQQQSLALGLAAQLRKLEASNTAEPQSDYLNRYRDFKYQEALFEQFSRQLELARVDEGREGGLLQIVDAPQVPEKKSKPSRALIGIGVSFVVSVLLFLFAMLSFNVRYGDPDGQSRAKLRALWPALLGRA